MKNCCFVFSISLLFASLSSIVVADSTSASGIIPGSGYIRVTVSGPSPVHVLIPWGKCVADIFGIGQPIMVKIPDGLGDISACYRKSIVNITTCTTNKALFELKLDGTSQTKLTHSSQTLSSITASCFDPYSSRILPSNNQEPYPLLQTNSPKYWPHKNKNDTGAGGWGWISFALVFLMLVSLLHNHWANGNDNITKNSMY